MGFDGLFDIAIEIASATPFQGLQRDRERLDARKLTSFVEYTMGYCPSPGTRIPLTQLIVHTD